MANSVKQADLTTRSTDETMDAIYQDIGDRENAN